MAKFSMDITSFTQYEGESLYETLERFKDLQKRYPHHGLLNLLVVQIFYNGFNYPTEINIDASVGGVLMKKLTNDTQVFIEKIVSNNYQWTNKEITQEERLACMKLTLSTF